MLSVYSLVLDAAAPPGPGKVAASAPCGGHVCGLLALGSDVNKWLREPASHRCIFYMIMATWADICGRKCPRLKRLIMRPRSNLAVTLPAPATHTAAAGLVTAIIDIDILFVLPFPVMRAITQSKVEGQNILQIVGRPLPKPLTFSTISGGILFLSEVWLIV